MSRKPSRILSSNIVLNSQYWRCLNNRKTYLFLLGLTLSLGDIKLIVATILFTGTMLVSYQSKSINWKRYYQYLHDILNSGNKQLILSVFSAGMLAISSYLVLNIWIEIDNKWLALGIIWQIIFSSIGLGFLGWKITQKNSKKSKKIALTFSELIHELNAKSPLQRLWAINQIIKLWENYQLTEEEIRQAQEYFSILKHLETENIIINKLDKIILKMNDKSLKPLNFPVRISQKLPQL
ncbi:hypothetical protein ACN4EE_07435 [Geminocystis sp. CENA526]|uniref:hypothetical protein n=1 Tax=Geminocystis sp. CENA526 TaxID=1355871 RepID=UPI003D6F087D